MRKVFTLSVLVFAVCALFVASNQSSEESLTKDFVMGTPGVQSIDALTFGPEGILFIGDSKSAAIFAIATDDKNSVENAEAIEMQQLDKKVAAALGTEVKNISIQDMAVNPLSKKVYFAVHHADGTPVLLSLEGETFQPVALDNIMYSATAINNAPAEDAKDDRGRSLRVWAVSDLNYDDGKVMVTGLSNQEFSSTFRSIAFPFTDVQEDASLEIYHAAHGRYETYAPIKTFTAATINGKKHIIASYTCTPLVLFPIDDLKAGTHVKGRTVAEMGNGNTPLDIITMEKDGAAYILMANSNRPVMKVKIEDIEAFDGTLTEPVEQRSATAGVDFITFPMVNVLQMDKLDDSQFVMLQRKANGDLDLWTANDRWL